MWKKCTFAFVVGFLNLLHVSAGEPKVADLKTQQVGSTTYFYVRFETPPDLQMPANPLIGRLALSRIPKLVPQDKLANCANLNLRVHDGGLQAPTSLEFYGRANAKGKAKFLLLYPIAAKLPPAKESALEKIIRQQNGWKEIPVTLDLESAPSVAAPKMERRRNQAPAADDFEGKWADSQAAAFAIFESLTPQFGFYSVARESIGRRYGVAANPLPTVAESALQYDPMNIYGIMTATSLITEALALNRLTEASPKKKEIRNIDIKTIPGIDDPEHPWKKMMAGKKPSASPVAKMIPNDNYFVHFKNISKLIEFADWLEPTGNTAAQLFNPYSRDDRLKQRYEEQMCIEMNFIARLFGPALIKSISLTGSDPYVREGSDVTIILRVANRTIFLLGANKQINSARSKWGKQLKETKAKQGKITLESYVTPLREVSLHRAIFDDYIIYSNSKVALHRVLEIHAGKRNSLADSADFQYMRSVFPIEDKKEDGFVFMSGAFVRNLVGPALRIKERRRLEALTSMQIATHGALVAGWLDGKLPADDKELAAATRLTAGDLRLPDGATAVWNAKQQAAISKIYNTIHFATPLIEIPIDKVTPTEQMEYGTLRKDYLAKYANFLDPIGIRFAIDKKQVRVEVLATPLTNSSEYQWVRDLSPGGKVTVHPDVFDPNALMEAIAYVSPESPQAKTLMAALRRLVRRVPPVPWIGSMLSVKLDDNAIMERYAEQFILEKLGVKETTLSDDLYYLAKLPLSGGISIQRPVIFRGVLIVLQAALGEAFPDTLEWTALPPYQGVQMVRVKMRHNGFIGNLINGEKKGAERISPTVYYAMYNKRFYLAQNVESLKQTIAYKQKLKDQPPDASATTEANAVVQITPAATKKSKGFVDLAAAWETHHRALANTAYLLPLFRSEILTAKSTTNELYEKAHQFFGYVPVSADGRPFFYSDATGEVVNKTHGSLRKPQFSRIPPAGSPTAKLLTQFRWIRADINFEENGLRLVTTLRKK